MLKCGLLQLDGSLTLQPSLLLGIFFLIRVAKLANLVKALSVESRFVIVDLRAVGLARVLSRRLVKRGAILFVFAFRVVKEWSPPLLGRSSGQGAQIRIFAISNRTRAAFRCASVEGRLLER
jgi:hypothetical protein